MKDGGAERIAEVESVYPMDYYGKEGLGRVKAEDVVLPGDVT